MPQHRIELIKVAPTKAAMAFIKAWKAGGVAVPLNQYVAPWLLYWSCWYDPWLMSHEYDIELRRRKMEVVFARNCPKYTYVVEIAVSARNRRIVKTQLRKPRGSEEIGWLFRNLEQAAVAYEKVIPNARMFLKNEVIATVLDDKQLLSLLKRKAKQ